MKQIEKHQAWLRKGIGLKQYAFEKVEREGPVHYNVKKKAALKHRTRG